MAQSSQQFIADNRAPRVHIQYDVHVDGAEKKVELPFVMGVFADLCGNRKQLTREDIKNAIIEENHGEKELTSIELDKLISAKVLIEENYMGAINKRKIQEIDVDNFDKRLKGMRPRVAFIVSNALTGQGSLNVDLTFENMDDFSPAAIVKKVAGLDKLLEARTQLANLMTYMDGKSGAEELIANVINDPALLQSLIATPKPEVGA
jgi:type VI secretion system protein ImpB